MDNVPVAPVGLNHSIPFPGIGTLVAREVQVDPSGAVAMAHGLRITGDPASGPLKGSQLIVAGAAAGIPGVTLAPPSRRRGAALTGAPATISSGATELD